MTYTYKEIPVDPMVLAADSNAKPTRVRRSDGWKFNKNGNNPMAVEYREWVAAGNTPEAAD